MEPTTTAPAAPAAQPASTGYMSNPFAYIGPAWKALLLNLWTVIWPGLAIAGVAIVLVLIGVLGAAFSHGSAGFNISLFILGGLFILAVIALIFIFIPYTIIIYLAGMHGQKVGFKEVIAQCPKYAFRVLGGAILAGLAVLGGFILLIVPGFIFGAWFSLTTYVIVAEDLGVIEAMKRSKALVKGHVVETWGIVSMGTILGSIPIVNFVASLISGQAMAIRYEQLIELQKSGEKPAVHWANYLAIVIAIATIPLNYYTQSKPSQNQTTPTNLFQPQQ